MRTVKKNVIHIRVLPPRQDYRLRGKDDRRPKPREWLESRLRTEAIKLAKAYGCKVYPVAARGRRGFPDITILIPGGVIHLVELKQLRGRVAKLQEVFHKELMSHFDIFVVYGYHSLVSYFLNHVVPISESDHATVQPPCVPD